MKSKSKFKAPITDERGRKPILMQKATAKKFTKGKIKRICALEDCRELFIAKNSVQKYCSPKCSHIANRRSVEPDYARIINNRE